MEYLKILVLAFCIVSVSGFDLEKNEYTYSSKTEAFEECEDWKDEGKTMIYATNINIAEEASRFSLEHPTPSSHSSGSSIDQLKYADRLYEWNQSVENFLAKYPTKTRKVYSRMCEYEPNKQLFVGYENKQIQEGAWKDEEGMRGRMVEVKFFHY
jgi:hypothetical protein